MTCKLPVAPGPRLFNGRCSLSYIGFSKLSVVATKTVSNCKQRLTFRTSHDDFISTDANYRKLKNKKLKAFLLFGVSILIPLVVMTKLILYEVQQDKMRKGLFTQSLRVHQGFNIVFMAHCLRARLHQASASTQSQCCCYDASNTALTEKNAVTP